MPREFKGSLKLSYVLDLCPELCVESKVCADLGCNVGGFTAELLKRNAKKVYAIDCGYGTLDWNLRQDKRVDVHERQNALHADWLKEMDIVTSDLAWTRQEKIIQKVFGYIKESGYFFSLLKPQYEKKYEKKNSKHILDNNEAESIAHEVVDKLSFPQTHSASLFESPIKGGRTNTGNLEYWIVFKPRS